jgi:peptidoglycan/xylan/chitin deacetylase (PgdA/CDA1 family)
VLCLCYHAVSPDWPSSLAVTPAQLERQLSALVSRGWVGTTFTRAVLDPPARHTLAVTFDDAFASVIELALPILSALGLSGTVFAPTAFMSRRQPLVWDGVDHWGSTPHAHELTSMNWSDLRALSDQGWEIGSHTRTHPHLPALADDALAQELSSSRADCERELGTTCQSIAYPYGDVDQRVATAAGTAGYLTGACLARDLRLRGASLSPRVGVYRVDVAWRFRLKTATAARFARRIPIWA